MATFTLDAATEPTYLDIIDIAAGYGIFSTPMDGLFPGDLVQTMTLVVTDAITNAVALSKAIDISQRTQGYFEWVTSSSVDAHWTFTAADIATLQGGVYMYSCSAMIYRSSQTYTREYQGGSIAARPTVPLPPLLVNSVVITGGPIEGNPLDTFQLAAITYDGYGNVITGQTVIWSSSNAAIASVNQAGLVTLVTSGNAIITASCQGITATTTASCQTTPVVAVQGDILIYNATDELFEAASPTVDHFLPATFGGDASSVYAFPGFATVAAGLTVTAGGITVVAGTSALQSVTATTVTATTFTGALVGNASTATTAGNAATATALQTGRTINGVLFDGTANIVISAAADAGLLTGTILAANVVASSLASTGAITGGAEGATTSGVGSLRMQSDSALGAQLWQKRLGSDAYGWRPLVPLTPVGDVTTFWTFGDSITAGQGATSTAHDFVQIVLSNLPSVATTTQYAVSGTGAYTAIAAAYNIGASATPRTANLATWMAGLNDLRRGGGAAKTIAKIQNCLTAWIGFMLSDTSIAADNAAVTATGAWSAFAPAGAVTRASVMGGNALSASVGSTLSWNFTGDSLVIGTWVADGTSFVFGSASITVDGVVQTTFNANNGTDGIADSAYNNQRVPGAIVLRGLGSGAHTVIVTPLDTTFVVDYFSTLRRPGAAQPVIIGTPPRLNAIGYAQAPSNATDAIVAQGANAIAAVAYTFVDYPVALAWPNTEYNVATMISGDNIHPANAGHAAIARAFLDVARLVTNPTTFSSITSAAGSLNLGASPPTTAGINIDAATYGNYAIRWQNTTAQGFVGASSGTIYLGAFSNHQIIVRTNNLDRLILLADGTQLYPTTTSVTSLGITGNRWSNFFSNAGTITNGFTVGNGLTVSAGTTAIQALTATTGTFSSTLGITGQVSFGGATNVLYVGADGTQIAFNRNPTGGAMFNASAFGYVWNRVTSVTNTSDLLRLQVYDTSGSVVTTSALVVNGLGAVSIGVGLTVSAGTTAVQALTATSLSVTPGTSALQAMTATTGSYSSTLAVTGQISQGGATNIVYVGSDGTQLSFNRNPTGGTMFNSSAFGYVFVRVGSITNTSDILKLNVYDPAGTLVTQSAIVVNGLGAVTIGIGLTVTTGGITVSAGTTAVQALTATTGGFTGNVTVASITSGTWTATAIAAGFGGTGLTTYAVGDMLYASATTPTIAKLTIGSSGQFLWVTGGLPAWRTLVAADVSDLASATVTFTNKRITKRTGTTTSSATPTINTDTVDFYSLTAQSTAITSFTTNLSGTPTVGQTLWIAITDDGTARAITWGTSFEASTVALPTTTVISTRLDVGFVWNSITSKWRCVASA